MYPVRLGETTTRIAAVRSSTPSLGVQMTFTTPNPFGSCSLNTTKRITHIIFVCGVGPGRPVFTEQARFCNFYFEWATEYACVGAAAQNKTTTDCSVQDAVNNYAFDLSPLAHTRSNWVAAAPDGSEYLLNVCRPLVATPALNGLCLGASVGACQVLPPGAGGNVSEFALGNSVGPTLTATGIVLRLQVYRSC
jgi:hypothetical protein